MVALSPIHILAFGNSITAGWVKMELPFHPYSGSLISTLQQHLPSAQITVDVQGMPGDQVVSPTDGSCTNCGVFVPRITTLFEETQVPYTWAIILGGTNDFSMNRETDTIWEYLQKTWEVPLRAGTKVLALTVPENGANAPEVTPKRDRLNDLIRSYEAENFYVYDLHDAVPYWSMPLKRRNEIWSDGTHFKAAGYDLIGSLLADRLFELISQIEEHEAAQRPTKGELKRRKERAALREKSTSGSDSVVKMNQVDV